MNILQNSKAMKKNALKSKSPCWSSPLTSRCDPALLPPAPCPGGSPAGRTSMTSLHYGFLLYRLKLPSWSLPFKMEIGGQEECKEGMTNPWYLFLQSP